MQLDQCLDKSQVRFCRSLFNVPFSSDVLWHVNNKSDTEVVERLTHRSRMQCSSDTLTLNIRDSPRLGSYLPDDEWDDIGYGVSMKAEALEPDLAQLRLYR